MRTCTCGHQMSGQVVCFPTFPKSVNRTEFCQQTRAEGIVTVEALQEDKGCRRWGPCLPQQHTSMEGLGVTEGVKSPGR